MKKETLLDKEALQRQIEESSRAFLERGEVTRYAAVPDPKAPRYTGKSKENAPSKKNYENFIVELQKEQPQSE